MGAKENDLSLRLVYRVLGSRRSAVSLTAILCLTAISLKNGTDTSMAIASVAAALSAGNAYQRKSQGGEDAGRYQKDAREAGH